MSSRHHDLSGRDHHRDSRDRDVSKKEREFWISAAGINREVIQTEICFFLGNDARVRPGVKSGEEGYKITAYRNLTEQMLRDLRTKSAAYTNENRQKRLIGQTAVRYEQSATFQDDEARDHSNHHAESSKGYPAYPKRGYDEYEIEQAKARQFQEPPRAAPAGYPQGYIVAPPTEYANQQRNQFPQGNPGIPYQNFEQRPDNYQPRTPQSMEDTPPISRAPLAYVPHSGPQYVAPAPARGAAQPYYDPRTGQTVYVEAGFDQRYDVEPPRQLPGGRATERDYRRAR